MCRRGYLDWLRGFAVLIMVEAHLFDSWVHTVDRGNLASGGQWPSAMGLSMVLVALTLFRWVAFLLSGVLIGRLLDRAQRLAHVLFHAARRSTAGSRGVGRPARL